MTSDPDFNSANALDLANTYMAARNYRRAEEVLRSALLHNPHDATLLTERAGPALPRRQQGRGAERPRRGGTRP
jgi:Flp pilus assembly protein TadD